MKKSKKDSYIDNVWKPLSGILIAITLIFSAIGGLRSMYFWVFGHPLSIFDKEIILQHPTHVALNGIYVENWVYDKYPDITASLTNTTNVTANNVILTLIHGKHSVKLKRSYGMNSFPHINNLSISPHNKIKIPLVNIISFYNLFKDDIVQCNKQNMGSTPFNDNDFCFLSIIDIKYQSPYGIHYNALLSMRVAINKKLLLPKNENFND